MKNKITREDQLKFPANFEFHGILILVKCIACDIENPRINAVGNMMKSKCAWCGWKEEKDDY